MLKCAPKFDLVRLQGILYYVQLRFDFRVVAFRSGSLSSALTLSSGYYRKSDDRIWILPLFETTCLVCESCRNAGEGLLISIRSVGTTLLLDTRSGQSHRGFY